MQTGPCRRPLPAVLALELAWLVGAGHSRRRRRVAPAGRSYSPEVFGRRTVLWALRAMGRNSSWEPAPPWAREYGQPRAWIWAPAAYGTSKPLRTLAKTMHVYGSCARAWMRKEAACRSMILLSYGLEVEIGSETWADRQQATSWQAGPAMSCGALARTHGKHHRLEPSSAWHPCGSETRTKTGL